MQGKGWKSKLGKTLVTLGAIGAAGNIGTKSVEGILGGSILGAIGTLLIKGDQSGNGIDRYLVQAVKSHMKQCGSGKKKAKDIRTFIKTHRDTPIHIKDVLGPDWSTHAKTLMAAIPMKGSGFVKDAKKTLSKFLRGKTKLKPSTLLNVLASAVGVAGSASALIPGLNLISAPTAGAVSMGLRTGAKVLQTVGRGYTGGITDVEDMHGFSVSRTPVSSRESVKRGSGLKLSGSGLEQWGDIMDLSELSELSGLEDPNQIPAAIEKLVISMASNPESLTKTGLGVALGIGGAALGIAYRLYRKHRKKKGSGKTTHKSIGGSLSMAGAGAVPYGVQYNKSGGIKRDRYSVYHGFHTKTASGLTKDAFFLDGKKVKSKKRSAMGKEAVKFLRK